MTKGLQCNFIKRLSVLNELIRMAKHDKMRNYTGGGGGEIYLTGLFFRRLLFLINEEEERN